MLKRREPVVSESVQWTLEGHEAETPSIYLPADRWWLCLKFIRQMATHNNFTPRKHWGSAVQPFWPWGSLS